jgi:hypothetical protein
MRRLGIWVRTYGMLCVLLATLGGLTGCVMDDDDDQTRQSCIDPVTLSVGPCRGKAERSGD